MYVEYLEKLEPGYPGLVIQGIKRRSGVYVSDRTAHRVRLEPDETPHSVTIRFRGVDRVYNPGDNPLAGLVNAIRSSDLYSYLIPSVSAGAVVLESRYPGTAYAFTITATSYTVTVENQASDGSPILPGVVVSFAGDDRTFRLGGTSPAGVLVADHVYGVDPDGQPTGIQPGRHIDVVQIGEVWGRLADGADPTNGAEARYVAATGLLTTATTGTQPLPGGVFRSRAVAVAGGIRIAKVSLLVN